MKHMNINIITQADLTAFKTELLEEISKMMTPQTETKEWMRSSDIIKMLNISASTLQTLRATGKLKYKKVNGMLFYSINDVKGMMHE